MRQEGSYQVKDMYSCIEVNTRSAKDNFRHSAAYFRGFPIVSHVAIFLWLLHPPPKSHQPSACPSFPRERESKKKSWSLSILSFSLTHLPSLPCPTSGRDTIAVLSHLCPTSVPPFFHPLVLIYSTCHPYLLLPSPFPPSYSSHRFSHHPPTHTPLSVPSPHAFYYPFATCLLQSPSHTPFSAPSQ